MRSPTDSSSVDVRGLALAPSPTVSTVEVGHEAILVDEAGGWTHPLNASGALVWACLDGVSSLDEICLDVSEVLGVPFERVAADVEGLARRLLDERLATAPGYDPPGLGAARAECICGSVHGDDGVHDVRAGGTEADDPRLLREPPNP